VQRVVVLGHPAGDVGAVHQREEHRVVAVEGHEPVHGRADHLLQRGRRVDRGERLAVRRLHLVHEPPAQLDRDRFLVREELVERAGGDAGLAGDGVGAGRGVARGREDGGRRLQELGDPAFTTGLAAARLFLRLGLGVLGHALSPALRTRLTNTSARSHSGNASDLSCFPFYGFHGEGDTAP